MTPACEKPKKQHEMQHNGQMQQHAVSMLTVAELLKISEYKLTLIQKFGISKIFLKKLCSGIKLIKSDSKDTKDFK